MGAACLAVVVQSMKCDVNVGSPAGNVVLWWAGCGVLEMVNSRICAKYEGCDKMTFNYFYNLELSGWPF